MEIRKAVYRVATKENVKRNRYGMIVDCFHLFDIYKTQKEPDGCWWVFFRNGSAYKKSSFDFIKVDEYIGVKAYGDENRGFVDYEDAIIGNDLLEELLK